MRNSIRKPLVFKEGVFTPYILSFIQYKRSCGLQYEDSAECTLRMICDKLNQYQIESPPELTKEMVENLAAKRIDETYATQCRRITYLRQLAIYLNKISITAYIIPVQQKPKDNRAFVPYLLSDLEIEKMFVVADNLSPIVRYPHYQKVYPVLLRLLYATGLRTSEALNLKHRSFDKINNTLLIENSKKGKTRCIPLSTSISNALTKYISCRFGEVSDFEGYIFAAPDGGRYSRGAVRSTIINIFKTAGIPTTVSEHHARVHDLRHLFAVKAMEKMKAEGVDLYCAMPLLSVYLGHKGLRETEKYLWLPQFRMAEVSASDRLLPGMIPEVSWDEE